MRIGFIGLGVMGTQIAKNLLEDGHQLRVFARKPTAAASLEEVGAIRDSTPSDVAARSDIVFTMVTDSSAVKDVALGSGGLFEGASIGTTWIDMSSISPMVTRDLAARADVQGIKMLDAPVSGGERGAAARTLAIMVGGEAETFGRMEPLLGSLGRSVIHVGDAGAGQIAKLCNQVIVAGTMCAVAEAFVLAQKAGVSPAGVRTAISGGAAQSRILDDHAMRMLNRTFTPGFRVSLLQKDLATALEAAKEYGAAVMAASTASQLMNALAAQRGDVDASAVIEVFESLGQTGAIHDGSTADHVSAARRE